jgi:hypothetical protein
VLQEQLTTMSAAAEVEAKESERTQRLQDDLDRLDAGAQLRFENYCALSVDLSSIHVYVLDTLEAVIREELQSRFCRALLLGCYSLRGHVHCRG